VLAPLKSPELALGFIPFDYFRSGIIMRSVIWGCVQKTYDLGVYISDLGVYISDILNFGDNFK
jgi:hypothetical protein